MPRPAILLRLAGLSLVVGLWTAAPLPADSSTLDARALIHEIETKYRADTAHAVMRMRITTTDWTRELVMESWARGRDDVLVEIREPARERGIRTLKLGSEIWNYLPRIDRLMKVPASMMGEGWMGSHVTNDDLVQDAQVDTLYDFEVRYADAASAEIVATPRPEAAVVWGQIVYRVDRIREVPVEVRYDDEDGEPVRVMHFENVREVGGRWVPMRTVVTPLDKPGESTVMVYEQLRFNVPVPDQRFSLRGLRR